MGERICPYCKAHLDPDEKCDCREERQKKGSAATDPDRKNHKNSMSLLWHGERKKSMIGKVEKYNRRRGFGFIHGDDGKKYFVPYCNVKTQSGVLEPGYTVEFNAGEGNRALNVRYL